MSMTSAQIDELRELTGDGSMEWVTGPIRASVLRDAADTIWELRCRLVDAEDHVRKSSELCKLCEREAENTKLRKLVRALICATDPHDRERLIINAAELLGEVDG